LFDENDRAVLSLIAEVIAEAHRANKPIGICGQAPSDFPEFARWLVQQGITSISLNPDVAIKTKLVIAAEEHLLYAVQPLISEVTELTTR
jgi:pyruvate,water dikinase